MEEETPRSVEDYAVINARNADSCCFHILIRFFSSLPFFTHVHLTIFILNSSHASSDHSYVFPINSLSMPSSSRVCDESCSAFFSLFSWMSEWECPQRLRDGIAQKTSRKLVVKHSTRVNVALRHLRGIKTIKPHCCSAFNHHHKS